MRLYYLDNLRALAMLLGVFFHASLAYSPLVHERWLSSSDENSFIIGVVSSFSHLFRMPVFFLISGFFSVMIIEKYGHKHFMKNRMVRIGAVFIIFYPLILILVVQTIKWALSNVDNLSPALETRKQALGSSEQSITTLHLWFLLNLLFFIPIMVLLSKLKFFDSARVHNLITFRKVVFVLPLVIFFALITQDTSLTPPYKLHPQLWSFGYFGVFFILGGLFFKKKEILFEFMPYRHVILSSALLVYAYYYMSMPLDSSYEADSFRFEFSQLWGKVPHVLAGAFVSVLMVLYCLLAAMKYLNKENRVLAFISKSSYWVYIVHLPILFIIQLALLDVEMSLWVSFLLSTSLTLIISMLSYAVLVRNTPVGWVLSGEKIKLPFRTS